MIMTLSRYFNWKKIDRREACRKQNLANEWRIRRYKSQDFHELRAIWEAADILLDDTDTAETLRQNLKRRQYQVFVAETRARHEHNHQFVGKPRLIGGVIVTFDGHRAYIYHFAVHRDFRGMGLGRALLETCERQTKLWGARHLRLTSRVDNSRAAARKLYQSLGWIRDDSICAYSKTSNRSEPRPRGSGVVSARNKLKHRSLTVAALS